ncbi:MAG TPA: SH3 domain-containing protein [Azospirillum sp.]|nr:SH3 domain-containing protein [Azospirillum sp.]
MRRPVALLSLLLVAALPAVAQQREEPGFTPRPVPTAVVPKLTPLAAGPKGKGPVALAPLLPLPIVAAPLSPVTVPGEPPPAPLPATPPGLPLKPKAPETAAEAAKPASPPAEKKVEKAATRTVYTKDDVFVRAIPGRDGKVLDALEIGTALELLPGEDDEAWARVARNGKVLGYVARNYLVDRAPGRTAAAQSDDDGDGCALPRDFPSTRGKPLPEGATASALADANIRQSPACNAKVLDVLEEGDTVTITGLTGTWYRVARKGRTLGYISVPLLGQAKGR